MTTIGITCPPMPGHLNPMLVIAEELRRRGHRVIVLNVADVEEPVRARDIEFAVIGQAEFPLGSLPAWQLQLTKRSRGGAVLSTVRLLADLARLVIRDGPDLASALGLQGLLIDQVEYGGSTVADLLRLPCVTIANGFHLNREPGVPSAYSAWFPATNRLGSWRDLLVYRLEEQNYYLSTIGRRVNPSRKRLGLRPYRWEHEGHSTLAQLTQCPNAFDFPRRRRPSVWHDVGPLRSQSADSTPFPFDELNGRPLVYASLGSLQGNRRELFAAIARACAPLDVQLVITHGYQLSHEQTTGFAGDPVVVPYAPQRTLLERASLVITHAGMNTVLDSLSAGVPMLAIPLTFEQPAIASRVVWHRAGERLEPQQASEAAIRAAVTRVLGDESYGAAARRLSDEISNAGGVIRAANVIEQAFDTRRPVPRSAPCVGSSNADR